ncbi:acyl-CoA dehydrogenase [Euzebya rosea]|uniref:acyl-CoA dehydrogenase n=1 Tax=Euzebya rosea TaxID=2052804 RepID=UPI001300AF0D|nr:acyl-CoA dehydrogenase [Euzebya rosea]
MDLRETPEMQAFREEVSTWLAANVPDLPPVKGKEEFELYRAWERALFDAGYAAIHWPKAFGGRDADLMTQAVFAEEYARANGPQRINTLGLGLAGPTLMVHGTPEQQAQWLPGILSCEDIWCQGFSEPDAGSDLAAIRTTAVLEDDHYVVNGQKIWTSGGRFADWIFTLVRTNPDVPKHKGITYLMIDMSTPGIEVRPINQINNDAGFAEVFFDDVRVPAENVVGGVDNGWQVAMTTLSFERGTGLGSHVRFQKDLDGLVDIVRSVGAQDDPKVRDRIAALHVRNQVFRRNGQRTLTSITNGKPVGPEASLNKLFWSTMERDIFETGMDVMGPLAELAPEADAAVDHGTWHKKYWYSRAACIYAGTTQIQKNIIAERVLGLPKEPRVAGK